MTTIDMTEGVPAPRRAEGSGSPLLEVETCTWSSTPGTVSPRPSTV